MNIEAYNCIDYSLFTLTSVCFCIYHLCNTCWCVYLIRGHRKSIRNVISTEPNTLTSESVSRNLRFNATKDKLLIVLILTEPLVSISYTLGYSYHFIKRVYPGVNLVGLEFNLTCIHEGFEESSKNWIDELHYPIVGFLFSLGRAMALLTLGISDTLLKFIANTYVTKCWRFKRVYRSLFYAIVISVLLIILGTIPYTNTLSRFLAVFSLFAYLKMLSKRLSFMSRTVLSQREQDMQYEVNVVEMQKQKRMKRRFTTFSSITYYGLVMYSCMELIATLESVIELFLYFGHCIFPVLYHIPYYPLITHEQLPIFNLALLVISYLERFLCFIGTSFALVPYFMCTIIIALRGIVEQRRRNSHTYRFRVSLYSDSVSTPLI